jgi:N-methylhydantoinase B/oxoprolinase/acetone carboxylase alpha subunit
VKLPRDSVLRICTPSGGGYGDVSDREPLAITRDLQERRMNLQQARAAYAYKG